MLKKVPINQLLPGMKVAKTDVGWEKVRYWQGPFTIETANDIVRLFESCKSVFVEIEGDDDSEASTDDATPNVASQPQQPAAKAEEKQAVSQATEKPVEPQNTEKPIASQAPKEPAASQSSQKPAQAKPAAAQVPAKPTLVKTESAKEALQRKISVEFTIASYHNTLNELSECFTKLQQGQGIDDKPLQESVKNLTLSSMAHPETLSMICNLKENNQSLEQKSLDVAVLSLMFGQALGMKGKALHRLAMAALLHDIGMLKIPEEILNQKQTLSVKQRQLIQKHVELGCGILKHNPGLSHLRNIVAFHHERHDGKGYPNRISSRKIPLEARILSIVTTYEALTRNRHFSEQHSTTHALSKLYALRNKAFDGPLVEQFIKAVGVYPVGTLVKLNNGYTGLVTEVNLSHRSRPIVQLLYKPDGRTLNNGSNLDLKHSRYSKIQVTKTLQPESLTENTLAKLRQNLGFNRQKAA